jgi:hypothetical protein
MTAQIKSTYAELSSSAWDDIITGSIGDPGTPSPTAWRDILAAGGNTYEQNLKGLDQADIDIQKSKAKATELKKLMRSQCIYTGTSANTSTNIDTIKTISRGGDIAVAGISEGTYLSNTYVDSMRNIIDYYGNDGVYQSFNPSDNEIINAGRGDIDVMPFALNHTGTDTADNWLYQYNNLYYPSPSETARMLLASAPQSPQIRIGDSTPNDKDWSCMGLKTADDDDCGATSSVTGTGYDGDLEKLQICEDNDKCHIVVHDLRDQTAASGTVPVKDDLGRGLYGRWDSKDLLCGDSKVCLGNLDSTYSGEVGTGNTCQDYYRQLIDDGTALGSGGVQKDIKEFPTGPKIDNNITTQQKKNLCERRINETGDTYLLGQDREGVPVTGCKYRSVPEYYKDLNLVDKCSISDLHKKLMDSGMTSNDMNQIEFTGQCPRRQIGYDLKWFCSDKTGRHKSNHQKGKEDCGVRKDCIDPDVYKQWVDALKPVVGGDGWDPQWNDSGYTVTADGKKLENDCSWRPVIERAEYVEEDSPCVLRCKGGSIQSGGQPYCDPPPDFLQGRDYTIGYLYPYLNPEWNTNDFSCTSIDERTCGEGGEFQRTISWDSNLNRHTIKTSTCQRWDPAQPGSHTGANGYNGLTGIMIGLLGLGVAWFSTTLQHPRTHWGTLLPAAAVASCGIIYGMYSFFTDNRIPQATLIGSLVLYFILLLYSGGVFPLTFCGEAQYYVIAPGGAYVAIAGSEMNTSLPQTVLWHTPLVILTVLFLTRWGGVPILTTPMLALTFFVCRAIVAGIEMGLRNPKATRWQAGGAYALTIVITCILVFGYPGKTDMEEWLTDMEDIPVDKLFSPGEWVDRTGAPSGFPPNKCKVYSDCKYDDNCIWDEIVSIIDDSKNYHYSSPSTEMMEVIYGFTYIIHKYKDYFEDGKVNTFTTSFYDSTKDSKTHSKLERLAEGSGLRAWMDGWETEPTNTDPTSKGSLFRNEHGDPILLTDLLRDAGLSEVQELKELFIYYWDLLHDGATGKLRGIDSNSGDDGSPGEIWHHVATAAPLVIRITTESQIGDVYSRGTEGSEVANDEQTRKGLPIIRLLLKDWINRNMSLSSEQCEIDKVCKYGKDESDKCKSACYNDEILDYSGAKCMTIDSSGNQSDLFADQMGHDSTSFRKFGPNFQRFYCELRSSGPAASREIEISGNTYQKIGCHPNDLINNDAIRGESCGDYFERTEASGYNIDCNSHKNIYHIKELGHNNQAIRSLTCWTQEVSGLRDPAREKICGFNGEDDETPYIWKNNQNIDSSNIDPTRGNSIFNPAAVGIGRSGSGYSEISPILSCCQKDETNTSSTPDHCHSGTWYDLSENRDSTKGICSSDPPKGSFSDGYTPEDITNFSEISGLSVADFCSHFSLTDPRHTGCPQ